MKKTITFLWGMLVLCLPSIAQLFVNPSNTAGYDQQKSSLILHLRQSGLTLVTDSMDYHPGSTVTINGAGFLSGETVTLQVSHANGLFDNDNSASHQPWNVSADNSGNFVSTWLVPVDEDENGA